MKKIGFTLLLVAGTIFSFYGYLLYKNNHFVAKPSREEVKQSYELGVKWLLNNRVRVLQDKNPILWWMIKQSAENTNDDRLRMIFSEFMAASTPAELNSVGNVFFNPEKYWGVNLPPYAYETYSSYQKYFLFGITCSKSLAEDVEIIKQHDVELCDKYDFTPACLTHQLIAFRFMERYQCDRVGGLSKRVHSLQEQIYRKLTKDPRVIDVYIQRVLMLVESGAAEKVKAVWVHRIIDEQLSDGSWSWKQRLVYLGFNHYLSFGDIYYVLYPGTAEGTFHTTAQGIWLMSLLLQEKNYEALAASFH